MLNPVYKVSMMELDVSTAIRMVDKNKLVLNRSNDFAVLRQVSFSSVLFMKIRRAVARFYPERFLLMLKR